MSEAEKIQMKLFIEYDNFILTHVKHKYETQRYRMTCLVTPLIHFVIAYCLTIFLWHTPEYEPGVELHQL